MEENKKKKLISFFALAVTCIFPVIFLYAQNVKEAYFKDAIMPIVLYLIIGIVCALLFYLFSRNISVSFFASSIFLICFANFALIERLVKVFFTSARYWHIVPILILIIIILACFMKAEKRMGLVNNLNVLLLISFGGLIVFNIIMASPTIIKKIQKDMNHTTVALDKPDEVKDTNFEKRNIYYIILDEYSSFNTIKKYYHYDNSKFAQNLEELGFNVSYDSLNESRQTYTITGNILNLDYIITDDMLFDEKIKLRENPPLFRLINEYGYKINNLSDAVKWDGVFAGGLEGVSSSKMSTFSVMLYSNSAMYPFVSSKNDFENRDKVLAEFNALQAQESNDIPVFTYAHIVCPHTPFVFDREGNVTPFSALNNLEDKKYYLDQYIFVTNKVYDTVKNIVKKDPNAIVIIQSDHSIRMIKDDEGNYMDYEDERSILNCVYYGGEKLDEIKGQSGLNTIRIVLSKLFEIEMPVLEVPINELKE